MKRTGADLVLESVDGIWDMDIIPSQLYQKRQKVCAIKFITLVNL